MVYGGDSAHPSGDEFQLFGASSSATEANSQASCTEAATFSLLARRFTGGGSGTNDVRFRVNGANGNQLASIVGAGYAEDSVNTDVLAAGDLFNLTAIDTGTDPTTIQFAKANVEFTSGHGNFHGSCAPLAVIFDVGAAVRFIPLGGQLAADGGVTEADQQWRNRGYTSVEAIQVRVTANARLNDSVFRLRVNGANAGTAITFAAGATGLQTVTGMGVALADGDLVCMSVDLGTGVEDLTVSFVAATFKSTSNKSETWAASPGGVVRAASATPRYHKPGGDFGDNTALTEANARIKVGFAARISNLRTYVSANTYTGDATLKLFVNGTAQITTTITASTTGWFENSVDTFDIDDNDEVCWEIDEGTSGSATFRSCGMTFSETSVTVTPGTVERGHEHATVLMLKNLALQASEYGHEALSVSLTQVHNLVSQSSEYGHETAATVALKNLMSDAGEYGYEAQGTQLTKNIALQDSEYGHEVLSVLLSRNLVPQVGEYDYQIADTFARKNIASQDSEYGYEATFPGNLIQIHIVVPRGNEHDYEASSVPVLRNLISQASEYGYEITGVLPTPPEVGAQDSEYGHESLSVSLTQVHNLVAQASEYGYEALSVLVSRNLSPAFSEYGHEFGAAQILKIIAAQASEYGYEDVPPGLIQLHSLAPAISDYGYEFGISQALKNVISQASEYGQEVSSVTLSINVVIAQASEYGYEAGSVSLISNVRAQAGEYGHESVFLGNLIQVHVVGVQSSEFVYAADAGRLIKDIRAIAAEFGYEAVFTGNLTQQHVLRPVRGIYGKEFTFPGNLIQVHTVGVLTPEFAHELKSVLLRHFQSRQTPKDRLIRVRERTTLN